MVRSGRCCCLVWLAAGAHVVGAQRVPKATATPTVPETAAPGTGCLFKEIPCPGKGPAAAFSGEIGYSSDVQDGLLCCNNDHACQYDSFGAPRCVRFDEQICDSGAVTLKDLRGASSLNSQISVPLPLFSSVSGISNTPAPTKEFDASLTSSAPFFKTFDKKENGKFSRTYNPLVYAKCNTTETACIKKTFPGVGKAAYCVDIADAKGPFCDFGFKKVVCKTDAECVKDPQDEGHCLPTKGANSVFMCTNKLKGKDGRYSICKTGSTCTLSTSKVPVPLCIGKGFQLCDGGGPKPNICLNSEKCVIDKNKNGQCIKTGEFLCDAGTAKGAVAVCSADQTCIFDSASDGNCLDKGQVLCDNGFAIGTASSSSSTFNDAQDGVLYCDTNKSENCLIQLKTNSPTCLNTAASKTACRDDNFNFGCGSGFECNDSTGACEATQNYGVAPDQLQGAAFSAGANLAATVLAALLATLALFCL